GAAAAERGRLRPLHAVRGGAERRAARRAAVGRALRRVRGGRMREAALAGLAALAWLAAACGDAGTRGGDVCVGASCGAPTADAVSDGATGAGDVTAFPDGDVADDGGDDEDAAPADVVVDAAPDAEGPSADGDAEPDACVPDCEGRACGPDGCGG